MLYAAFSIEPKLQGFGVATVYWTIELLTLVCTSYSAWLFASISASDAAVFVLAAAVFGAATLGTAFS